MPYVVNFTDIDNKTPITVFDNTSNQDTSLIFPGRNVSGYGQIIGENFLHLLENFASGTAPINPIEGQLWYDTLNGVLQLWDNTNWKAASNVQKGPAEPSVETSKIGELWVDTTNQQLRIFSGTRWILVGPNESSIDGLRYGLSTEQISDSDNNNRNILIFYISDVPVIIISKDSFTPKIGISGFSTIKSGVNIATPSTTTEANDFASTFLGGNLPKLIGTAQNADALNIGGVEVAAGKFLRSDQINTTDFGVNVRSNAGVTIGIDGNFNISNTETSARIYNSASGSSIDLQTNRDGIPSTVLRVINNTVGINVASPNNALDVDGDIGLTGSLLISNTQESLSLTSGSIITAGGISVTKSVTIGNGLKVEGTTQTKNIVPEDTETYDLGTAGKRWNNVRAKTITADTIQGNIDGNITGNANTATNLKNVTSFSIAGDVIAPAIQFDGQVGSYNKIFNTTLTANIIKTKDEPSPLVSSAEDFVLVYRPSEEALSSSGLIKQTRNTFVGDLGVPIGAILPFSGANAPYGYLLCDGSEIQQTQYPDLYDVIGTRYNGSAPLIGFNTYRIPDLRGRFPLGKHNMDNNLSVPINQAGADPRDAGGGEPSPPRVEGTEASTLAASAGQSSVTLTKSNLPDHSHTLQSSSGDQFAAVRVDTALSGPLTSPGLGPTAPGQAQYLRDSGGITPPNTGFVFGTPVGIMNPFLTLNYIIRSGPPKFTAS